MTPPVRPAASSRSCSRTTATIPGVPAPEGVVPADNLDVLRGLPDGCVDLVYIDPPFGTGQVRRHERSEEHTSELQSHVNLVCRLVLEKKKKTSSWTLSLQKNKKQTSKH